MCTDSGTEGRTKFSAVRRVPGMTERVLDCTLAPCRSDPTAGSRNMKMRIRITLVLFATALLLPGAVGAQHFPSDDDLTALIRSRVEEDRAVGIVLGVLEADGSRRIVWYGDAGPTARPLGARSLFEIGSITKVFTATLLGDMVARGEVALSDPVSDHLPDRVTMPSRGGREITLLDLSTHHSALPRLPDNMSPANRANPYADYTVEQMYAFLSGHELRRDIGSEFEYSNLAVGLLGHVLARVGGGSYEDVVRERVLEPLGMNMTGITLEGDMRDWMAEGHNQGGDVAPLWDLPTLAGAGALRSDIEDMLTFLDANTGPPESRLERTMRANHEVRESMNAQTGVGLNWLVQSVGEEKIVWHNGGTAGFRTFIGFDPEKGVGAVVLTNSGYSADDIGMHLINPEVPLTPAPVAPGQEVVAARYEAAIAWVNLVVEGEFEQAAEQAHEAVAAQMSAEVLEDAWAQLGPQLGELTSLEPREQSLDQGLNLVVLTGVFSTGTFDVQVYMDDDHAIGGFFVRPPGPSSVPDPSAGRIEVEVDQDILETYVGEYELAPTFVITVTVEEGGLFAQATDQERFALFAEAETEFFLRAIDAQVSFTKDDSGAVTGLILHQSGVDQQARKVR